MKEISEYVGKKVRIVENLQEEKWDWLVGKEGVVLSADEDELRIRLIPDVSDSPLNVSWEEIELI